MHPEKRLNDFGCNRMDDALKKAPSVRIDVIEILAHTSETLRLLRPRVDIEPKAVVLDLLNYGCRTSCRDLRSTRTPCQRHLAEERALGRRQNAHHKKFA